VVRFPTVFPERADFSPEPKRAPIMIIYSVVMSKDTLAGDTINDLDGLDRSEARLKELSRTVLAAHTAVKADVAAKGHTKGNYLTVFLAPEYYFAKKPSAHTRFIEQGEKRHVVARLIKLSEECPDTLIVPGTVPWWRPAYQGDDATDKARVDRIAKRYQDARGYNYDSDSNYLNGVGWTHARSGMNTHQGTNWAPAVDTSSADAPVDLLRNKAENAYIAQNTAYIACNGKVLKYHKVGNFREVNGEVEHTVVFAPGHQLGSFSVGNLRFALEICRDNGVGVYSQNGGAAVHIHLIVSASIDAEHSHLHLQPGGMLLHADSDWTTARDSFQPPTTFTRMTANLGFRITFLKCVMNDGVSGITPTTDMKLTSTTLGYSEPPPVRPRRPAMGPPPLPKLWGVKPTQGAAKGNFFRKPTTS
jgi:hypothetical protein